MLESAPTCASSIGPRVGSAYLASLVLCHFVVGVFLAVSAFAVCAASLWYVHLLRTCR